MGKGRFVLKRKHQESVGASSDMKWMQELTDYYEIP
jgi:hypothetical protein